MLLLWKIFYVFSRVALFSWGGGPASMALMQRETTALGWVTPAEFADAVALGTALPGPIAPQVSAFVGYKLAGVPGAIAAAAGTVIPTTLLILILITFFFNIKENKSLQAMLTVVRPAVIGLLLWTTYDMATTVMGANQVGWGKALITNWDKGVFALASFALLTFTSINPVFIIVGSAVLGYILYH
jgi:chromate transporter